MQKKNNEKLKCVYLKVFLSARLNIGEETADEYFSWCIQFA